MEGNREREKEEKRQAAKKIWKGGMMSEKRENRCNRGTQGAERGIDEKKERKNEKMKEDGKKEK